MARILGHHLGASCNASGHVRLLIVIGRESSTDSKRTNGTFKRRATFSEAWKLFIFAPENHSLAGRYHINVCILWAKIRSSLTIGGHAVLEDKGY